MFALHRAYTLLLRTRGLAKLAVLPVNIQLSKIQTSEPSPAMRLRLAGSAQHYFVSSLCASGLFSPAAIPHKTLLKAAIWVRFAFFDGGPG